MAILGSIIKNAVPHLINGAKQAIGANTKIGRKINAHKIGSKLIDRIGAEPKPIDADGDGVISDNELAAAQLKHNERVSKMIAVAGYIILAVVLKYMFPEQVAYFIELIQQFIPYAG